LHLTTPIHEGRLLVMQSARRAGPLTPARQAETMPESGERLKAERQGPLSHEPEMETFAHVVTFVMLLSCLRWWWRKRKRFFAAGNLSIYYPVISPRTGHKVQKKLSFRGPDFFVVLGVDPNPRRRSWVVENEGGKYPNVIVEILSKRTESKDRGEKKAIYQKIFKTHEYFLYDPEKLTIEGYRLVRGRYAAIAPDPHGRLWSAQLQMAFGVHEGQLRWFTLRGKLVPMPDESALAAMAKAQREAERAAHEAERAAREAERATREAERAARAEREEQRQRARAGRAEQEKVRAEQEKARLIAKLRELGVDPESIGSESPPDRF
jgi:Uma2 family endonuclease